MFSFEKVGITVTEYITLVRLRAAIQIMLRNDESCLEIALKVGFGYVRTFERACRKFLVPRHDYSENE